MTSFLKALAATIFGAVALLGAEFVSAQPETTAAGNAGPIAPANVGRLKLVFSFRTDAPGSLASGPAQADGLVFLLTPFPPTLFAIDPNRPKDPVRWRYAPHADGAAERLACCERMGNGPTVADGRVFFTTLDGHVLALDEESGAVAWDASLASPAQQETLIGAPLVAGGKVFVGVSGGDYGARGWIAALDEASGKTLWRKFSTGSDDDVGIGADFKPFYAAERGANLGVASWPPTGWEHGGGAVSGPILYDAGAKLLLHGTGRPAPWNANQRPGDNKWTAGLFARDAETGAARWFDPLNPHDLFALGGTGPNLMLDSRWRGQDRRLLLHLDGNGYLYVIDRASGEVLDAQAFAPANATDGVDLKTGGLRRDPAKTPRENVVLRDVCPGWPGAAEGEAALSADAKLLFIPLSHLCMDLEVENTSFIRGTAFMGARLREKPPADSRAGGVLAWDISAGKAVWTAAERFPIAGGVLATQSGLVFYGTLDGMVKALDARSGREVWSFQLSSGVASRPLSYFGPDGKEYVAVVAGLDARFDVSAVRGVDVRDATAAHGLANALRDLPPPSDPSGALYVFALP